MTPSVLDSPTEFLNTFLLDCASKVLKGDAIDREEALRLMALEGEDLYDLLHWANKIRLRFHGNKVELCSIVNAKSGACSENCKYCAQSAHYHTETAVYSLLKPEELEARAQEAINNGAKCFGIVTAWNTPPAKKDWEQVLESIRRIRALGEIRVGGSLGELTADRAKELHDAGLQMYNHNIETSARFFPEVCTSHTREDRLRTIRYAQEAGMEICSGVIMGMGETVEDRVDAAFDLREIGHRSVTMNFLHPVSGTPFQNTEPLKPLEILRIIGVYRFILPQATLRICGGRELNLRDMQSWMFYAGGSGTMVGNYLTTQGRSVEVDHQFFQDFDVYPARWSPEERESLGPSPGVGPRNP